MNPLYQFMIAASEAQAARRDALQSLLTGESLTTARANLNERRMRPTPIAELRAAQGFEPDFVQVGSGLPPDIRALAREVADNAFLHTTPSTWPGLAALAAERDAQASLGPASTTRESVLGQIQATPARQAPSPRPIRLARSWGDRFDYGVLVSAICITGFFALRTAWSYWAAAH